MPSPVTMLITPGGSPASSSRTHDVVRRELLGVRRLPHDGVAHQRRGGRQVAGDRGEVERRDRVDEALERAVVDAVPDAGPTDRLVGEDLPGERDVEPPEVDELAGRVDLGLDRRLGLAEHRRRVEPVAPRPGQQVGRLEEDRGPVVERTGRATPARRPWRRRSRPTRRRGWRSRRARARGGARAAGPRRTAPRRPGRACRRSSRSARTGARPARRALPPARRAPGCPARTTGPAR